MAAVIEGVILCLELAQAASDLVWGVFRRDLLRFEMRTQILAVAWGHIAFEMLKPEYQQVTTAGPLQPTRI